MTEVTGPLTTALAGRYRVEKHLGEGGMATVYLAHDLKHDRKVALKVLRPELAAVIGAERFLNEIRVTANLQHPHILPLHDSGDADSFLFYVMPYVEGDTLRDKLDREKELDIDEAVSITRAIASALDYAHRQGIIHRDIKPSNILMLDGQPTIADFGIALAVSHASGQRLTETGLSIGTPHYMSPEQAMGDREVDPRSDVYSLAAMLYEMIAGEPPYSGTTAQAIVAKVITSKPSPLHETRDTVPPHVEAAVAKALHKSPADRFPTAAAFAEALANPHFTTRATARAPAAAAPPTRTRRTAAAAVAGATLVGVLSFFAGRSTAPRPTPRVARFPAPVPEGVTNVAVCCGPAQTLSPDGEWYVFVGVRSGTDDRVLYRRRLGQLNAEIIPGTEGASSPFFSPDGLFVGFHSDGRIRKVPVAGGPPVPIADVDRIDGGSWGDNDVIVFTTAGEEGSNLFTVPAAGGVPVPVPSEPTVSRRMYPWMLPGGEAALARTGTGSDPYAVAVDLTTGREDTLGFAGRAAYASGHLVTASMDGTLLAQPFDAARRRTTGPAVVVLDGVRTSGPGVGEYALSTNGTLVYVAGGGPVGEQLVIQGPGGPVIVPLTTPGDNLEDPAFSPDGRRVALMVQRSGDRAVWLWDRDQQTQQLVVEDAGMPVWSPDGTQVAVWGEVSGRPSPILVAPIDASRPPDTLLALDDADLSPGSWTSDGRALAFRAAGRTYSGSDIGLLTIESGEVRWPVEDGSWNSAPQISPDDRWIAYSSDRSGQREVYVRALDGTGGLSQISAGGGDSPRWAPSGTSIYYATDFLTPLTEARLSFESGVRVLERIERPARIEDLNPGANSNWDVSPDDSELVYLGSPVDDTESEPLRFVWVLNWPEIVQGLSGGR